MVQPPPVTPPPGASPVVAGPDAPRQNPPVVTPATVEVKRAIAIRAISSIVRRAFVAGEAIRVAGSAPADCLPKLRLDGALTGKVATQSDGSFDLGVETRDLAAGRHVAEVSCSNPAALLARKVFWVAAPQTSSNLLAVVLASLLVVLAIGWVGLRMFAGTTTEDAPHQG